MYNVLIVDDEPMAIEALRKGVDWEKLGVSSVFTATNAARAREIFEAHEIQVMLCDIEMPRENGLELLKWVREKHDRTSCILLTCHAEFEYVREALHCGALEYMLKPSPYQVVEETIHRALTEYLKKGEQALLQEYGKYWEKGRNMIIEKIWVDYLNGPIAINPDRLIRRLNESGVKISLDARYGLIICEIRRWYSEQNKWDSDNLDFVFRNVLNEVFLNTLKSAEVLSFEKCWIVLLPQRENLTMDNIRKKGEKVINFFVENLKCDVCLYVAEPMRLENLNENCQKLFMLSRDNVAGNKGVFFLSQISQTQGRMSSPDVVKWKEYLLTGDRAGFVASLKDYVQSAVKRNEANASFLLELYHDLMQVLYMVLTENNVLAESLIRDVMDQKQWEHAPYTVDELLDWIDNLLPIIFKHILISHQAKDVVKKVNHYIQLHFQEEIRRDDMAKYVYLNPSYLSRMYKKETGISISDYVTQVRMEYARKCLRETDLNVTAIALGAGYTSLPHFTQTFRKMTGMTPREYKNKWYAGNKNDKTGNNL